MPKEPRAGFKRAALAVILGLLTACATATRPPPVTAASSEVEPGAGEDAAEDDEETPSEASADPPSAAQDATTGPCAKNMVLVASDEGRFCIDQYEGSLVEVGADGGEKAFPHWSSVDGHAVRAVSVPGVFPQGFISEVQAEDACAASRKRLCSLGEWRTACMGPSRTTFPYGAERKPGVCNDSGKSAVAAVFGTRAFTDPIAAKPEAPKLTGKSNRPPRVASPTVKGRAAETTHVRPVRGTSVAKASKKKADRRPNMSARDMQSKRAPAKASTRPMSVEPSVWTQLNDPRLGQVDGSVATTGSHESCVNGYGVFDMMGNLHEWTRTDPALAHGTFAGGYYLDTTLNGDGCRYRTTAHAHDYHDYSTGFRCCAEPK